MPMTISQAARRAGCTPPTIRYYEGVGLIPPAARTEGGRRTYGWPDVKRLQFIRRGREFGMSIEQIRLLLALPAQGASACAAARETVQSRIDEVHERRRELALLEASLEAMAARCDAGCGASGAAPCSIFEDIAASGG